MKKVSLIFLLSLIVFTPFKIKEVDANSALVRYAEFDNNGVLLKVENNSIIVTNEDLTFNISSFEYNEDNYVSSKYTFKNISNNTAKATLVFPFGDVPTSYKEDLTNLYDITVNDEVIDKKLRYTYNNKLFDDFDFKLDIDLNKLNDDYIEFDTLNKDTTVYHYKLKTNVDVKRFSYSIKFNSYEYLNNYFVTSNPCHYYQDNRTISFNNEVIDIYIIGEGIENITNRFTYVNIENRNNVYGTTEILEYETYSFKELVNSYYYESIGVSEIDHYNAIVCKINENDKFLFDKDLFYVYDNLLCWYEYDLIFKPNEEIVNEVEAPLFPTVYHDYKPLKFGYKYLLTPASTFNEFYNLNIRINTKYIMQYSNIEGFIKDDNGYSLSLDKLPEEDFNFILSTKKTSKRDNPYAILYLILFGVPILGIILLISIIFFIIKHFRRRKLRNI